MQLRSPAGNLTAVKEAFANGADAVYIGFSSGTNLRNYRGLNLSYDDAAQAVRLAHDQGKELYAVINFHPQKDELHDSMGSIDLAAEMGVDAVIVSDIANMEYISKNHPDLGIHCSVQTGSSNAEIINFWHDNFNVKCVVLPRVLNLEEIEHIVKNTSVEIEVFAMGSLCTGYSGRCHLSQYLTGENINTSGVCTSPKFITLEEDDREITLMLNKKVLSRFSAAGEHQSIHDCRGLTGSEIVQQGADGWGNSFMVNKRHVCKGQFVNASLDTRGHAMHDHVILNTLGILSRFIEAGVHALKIEGRQRPSTYSERATRVMREAIDRYYDDPGAYSATSEWEAEVAAMFREMDSSVGPYLGR